MDFYHEPVLVKEVLLGLNIKAGADYVDATIGGGGHSYHILKLSAPEGRLIGIDRDLEAILAAKKKLEEFSGRFIIVHDNFKNMKSILYLYGFQKVDGVLIDLGVSSHQIDEGYRGFSYIHDGPLDMRMDNREALTAKSLLNTLEENELKNIIKEYGEELWAARIANFIVNFRRDKEIETTGELVKIIEKAVPVSKRDPHVHPAMRTFQALRIAVNKELDKLDVAIKDAVSLLKPGGRIAVISFHSLEDRIVKNTFKELASACSCPPKIPVCICNKKPEVELLNKRPIVAGTEELKLNPRAKSAKLRLAVKLS
ncbi:MAG: 16S rRNA (cytosine(1402)-N(4))-methyltransferase RsmH [Bacillota bacterium]